MQQFEAGGLSFVVENRIFGEDGGPALRVFGDVDGESVQVLRFDCFRDDPHYHYDPSGKDDKRHLDKGADNVAWSMAQVPTQLVEMIRTAGYEGLASQVDMDAILSSAGQIEHALRTELVTA